MAMQQVTPEDLHERPNKRRRKILACLDCRRRKVQCDRRLPVCTRCEKGGRSAFCNYDDDANGGIGDSADDAAEALHRSSPHASNHAAHGSAAGNITISREIWDDLVTRLMDQERKLAANQGNHDPSRTKLHNASSTAMRQDVPLGSTYPLPESLMFRRKGFKAQLWGTTDTRKVFLPGTDLFAFTRNLFGRNAALSQQTKELRALDGIRKSYRRSMPRPPSDLKALLPPRKEAEHLIRSFIDCLDHVYCILHVPSFLEEKDKFWNDVQGHSPAFAALLLAMMAAVRSHDTDRHCRYMSMSSETRDIASVWITAVDNWLSEQSWKHTSLIQFQIRCVLLIAKQMNRHKVKRRWVETGNLINELITRGFHRNPDLIMDRTSVFDKEMRRRIWAVAVELDLDSSLDFGMPCRSNLVSCDAGIPLNVHDSDLTPAMTTLPASRPLPNLTKATYLHLAPRSRDLRRQLACVLNEPTLDLTFDQALTYTNELETQISEVQKARLANTDSRVDGAASTHAGLSVLDLQLQQYLCIINALIFRRTDLTASSVSFSALTFIHAAQNMLRLHKDLTQLGNNAILLYREDPLRILCWSAPVAVRALASTPIAPSMTQWLDLASTALSLVSLKSRHLGTLEPPVAFAFANYDFIRYRGKVPDDLSGCALHGVDQLFAFGRHLLDNQQQEFMQFVAEKKRTMSLSAGPLPSQPVAISMVNGSAAAAVGYSSTELGDFSAWDIDSWIFDPMAFGGFQPVMGDEFQ